MVEIKINTPDLWESTFPDLERRELAKEFVNRVSDLQSVKKIVAIDIGNDGDHITETPRVSDMENVMSFFVDVCMGKDGEELLGYTPVVTDDLFEEDLQLVSGLKQRPITVLWEKPLD